MCNYHRAAHSGYANGGFRPHFGRFGRPDFFAGQQQQAPVNITQKSDLYELEMYVAGKTREDFDIKVTGNELTISYKGNPTQQDSNGPKWVRQEFNPGNFERIFQLDDSIDIELITARYDNGVLIVLLPIKPESRRPAHKVEVG